MASPPPQEFGKVPGKEFRNEFGKRRPAPAPLASVPVKRSRHVALLLMGTMAVGGGAYALPRPNCAPNGPGLAGTSAPEAAAACATRSSFWSGHGASGGSWSRSGFYGDSSASSSGTATASGAGETTRGGFGGFARAFAAHFSGG